MRYTNDFLAVRVLLRAVPFLTQGIHLLWSSTRTRDTHTCRRAFGSEAVTTCLYEKALSQLGFEQETISLRGKCAYPFTTAAAM